MAVRVTICAAIVAAGVSAPAQADSARVRVVVLDIDAPGVSGADVAQLPDLLSQIISAHPGYEVVPIVETHRAIEVRQTAGSPCSTDMPCILAVARDTHADFALASSYTAKKSGYALELLRLDARSSARPERAADESPERANLSHSARSCLDRLFK